MHKFKKITAAMVTAAMMMSIVPFAAFADEADEEVADSPAVVEEEVEEAEEEAEAEAEPEEEESAEEAAPDEEKKVETIPQTEKSDEKKITIPSTTKEEYCYSDSYNSDDLFEEYANIMFYGERDVLHGGKSGKNLPTVSKRIYDYVLPELRKIADGERSDTEVRLPINLFNNVKDSYSASDLGLDYLYDFNTETWNPDWYDAYWAALMPDNWKNVSESIRIDCPYETYFGNGTSFSMGNVKPKVVSGDVTIAPDPDDLPYIRFRVDKKYRLDSENMYAADTNKTGLVKQAVDNARRIINNAAGMSDYNKLVYYKDRICEMVEYNHPAAQTSGYSETDYGPWALVYVFDDDTSTDVVCEGYSEAFQYLCDMTDFVNDDTYAYSVTGDVGGGHKWNIVHIDGENYLADVTHSDSQGDSGKNFMVGAIEGTYLTGYTIYYKSGNVPKKYTYDSEMFDIFTPEQLTLANHNYVPVEPQIVPVDDIIHPIGMDLVLSDDIAMNLYVDTDDSKLQPGDTVLISINGGAPVEQTVSSASEVKKTDYKGNEYNVKIFTIELNAKQMTDDVTFQVKRGDTLGAVKHYSIVAYARAILAGGYSETAKNLCRAMLNYGSYAQKYFEYHTDTLANADLTYGNDPIADNQTVTIPSSDYSCSDINSGLTFVGSSLVLKSKTCLRLYFTGDAAIKSEVCDIDSFATEHETLDNGYQVVTISGITADKLNDTFEIKISTGNGSSITIGGKPMTYCYKVTEGAYDDDLTKLVKSLYLYYQAAVAYQAA